MKHLRLTTLLLLLIGSLSYFGFRYSDPPVTRMAKNGVLDLRDLNAFEHQVSLNGQWGFHWQELLTETGKETAPLYISYPSIWNKIKINGKKLPSQGYATYSLTLLLPKERPVLALDLPENYCAYALYVNGKLLAKNGEPGRDAGSSKPYFVSRLVQLPTEVDSLSIAIQAANYWHVKGGNKKPLFIGSLEQLTLKRERRFALDLTLTGCLFMGGLFFLGLYLFGRHDKAILYFSLFCIVYSYRLVGANVYVLHAIFPGINWLLAIKLEYLTLSGGVALFVRYTMNLFPEEADNLFSRILCWFCTGYAIIVLLSPPFIFSSLLNIFLFAMFVCIAYALYIYIQAARKKRTGAIYALISTAAVMLVFLVINLHFLGWIGPMKGFVFSGYVAFFFLQSLILSHRFAHTLKKSAFEAEQGLKAKSEFLSTMSHEIRTPLNAVIGMTHLLLGNHPRKDQQENLDVLLFSANNLLTIVNDILDYNKIELGKINLERIPMDLSGIAKNLVLGLKELAVEKRVDLQLEIDEKLDKRLVGDPTRTAQVINNLLHNAVKFTHKGWVRLSIEVITATGDQMTVKVSVRDTGIGISKDKQHHIFERFTQADSSTSRSYGGTGLGLAICKKLLELQGSRLELESEAGKGSCFSFLQSFPRCKETMSSEEEPQQDSEDQAILLAGVSILLVEDNPFNVMVAQTILERSGTKIDVASNGAEALERFEMNNYDLVLMDLHMPVMDGYEATTILRSKGHTLPIIALTASTRNEVQHEVFASGLTDVIVKPFNPEELFRVILQHLHPAVR
jgi:signal transduction histidine kinase/ActR/RegA family two-component response regulator